MSAVKAWSAWSIAIKDIDMDAQFDGTVNFIFQPAEEGLPDALVQETLGSEI
jgi:metal-dependent amidase/aminoacylase/carboxypeptidase family protein